MTKISINVYFSCYVVVVVLSSHQKQCMILHSIPQLLSPHPRLLLMIHLLVYVLHAIEVIEVLSQLVEQ
jgi:hypothetical protein